MGYCIAGVFTSPDAANLFGVNTAVIANLFSGFVPLLGNNGGLCAPLSSLSSKYLNGPDAFLVCYINHGCSLAPYFSTPFPPIPRVSGWCYTHWVQRAFLAIELSVGYGMSDAAFNLSVSDEHINPYWPRDLWVLFVDALATYCLAFAIMVVRHRDKQR